MMLGLRVGTFIAPTLLIIQKSSIFNGEFFYDNYFHVIR